MSRTRSKQTALHKHFRVKIKNFNRSVKTLPRKPQPLKICVLLFITQHCAAVDGRTAAI